MQSVMCCVGSSQVETETKKKIVLSRISASSVPLNLVLCSIAIPPSAAVALSAAGCRCCTQSRFSVRGPEMINWDVPYRIYFHNFLLVSSSIKQTRTHPVDHSAPKQVAEGKLKHLLHHQREWWCTTTWLKHWHPYKDMFLWTLYKGRIKCLVGH